MNIKFETKAFIIGVFILMFASFLCADVYVKMIYVYPYESQEEAGEEQDFDRQVEWYMSDDYYFMNYSQNSTLYNISEKKAYSIDHKNKTFIMNSIDFNENLTKGNFLWFFGCLNAAQ